MNKKLISILVLVALACAGITSAQDPDITIFSGGGGGGAASFPLLAPAADNCPAPPYSFTSDTDTGICSAVADSVTVRTGGTSSALFKTGSSTVPAIGFVDAASGFSSFGGGNGGVRVIIAGLTRTFIANNGSWQNVAGLIVGWVPAADPTVGMDTGFSRLAAGVVGVNDGAAGNGWLQQKAARVRLSSNYTNATTTFSNTALSITVTTGRAYTFRLVLLASNSIAADGGKLDFNGGTATATDFRAHCVLSSATGTTLAQANAASTALATTINATTFVATTQVMWKCNGSFEPSSTGTFIVRAAENSTTTGTLTINRGSHLWIEDMP
jgi:hypothetical protein